MVIIKAKTWPVWQCKAFSPRVVSFFDYNLGTKFFSGIEGFIGTGLFWSKRCRCSHFELGICGLLFFSICDGSNQVQLITQ